MALENSAGGTLALLKRRWFAAALCVLAAAAPLGASWLVGKLLQADNRPAVLSVGILAGLAVGQLAGLRRGTLAALLIGPAVGFAAGFLDLKIFTWLYTVADWPLSVTALLPVWGGLFGIWVCRSRKSWSARLAIIIAIALADFAARCVWTFAARSDVASTLLASDFRPFIEGLVYSPAAIMIVAFTRRA